MDEVTRRVTSILTAQTFRSAPMPTSQEMREYREMVPDAPERFFRIVEAGSADASKRDEKLVDAEVRLIDAEIHEVERGRQSAVGLLIGCGALSAVFFATGNNFAGTAFLGLPVVGFLTQLLSRGARALGGERSRRKKAAKKRP